MRLLPLLRAAIHGLIHDAQRDNIFATTLFDVKSPLPVLQYSTPDSLNLGTTNIASFTCLLAAWGANASAWITIDIISPSSRPLGRVRIDVIFPSWLGHGLPQEMPCQSPCMCEPDTREKRNQPRNFGDILIQLCISTGPKATVTLGVLHLMLPRLSPLRTPVRPKFYIYLHCILIVDLTPPLIHCCKPRSL